MTQRKDDPSIRSADMQDMACKWRKIADLLEGQDAVIAGGEKYLPRFSGEPDHRYNYRLRMGKFTNIFRDICENLTAKPFSKKLTLVEKSTQKELRDLCDEDVDSYGSDLHTFARDVFAAGVDYGLGLILVDATRAPEDEEIVTVADQKRHGIRPYMTLIEPGNIVDLRTAKVRGKEEFVHLRLQENATEADGYEETLVERVRVYNRQKIGRNAYAPAVWDLFEKRTNPNTRKSEWVIIDSGVVALGVIPAVPFITGKKSRGGWRIDLPLESAADLQISHYRQESGLSHIESMCSFPMLCGEGITPPTANVYGEMPDLKVGPGVILFAPPNSEGGAGKWTIVEPASSSMSHLAANIDRTAKELRELGRQPLTAQSGNLTVVTTAFAAQKGNSAIEAWSLGLKDALEAALQLMCDWLGDTKSKPEIQINTDLTTDALGDRSMTDLTAMRKAGDVSQETYWSEAKRRGVLSPEFDPEKERERLRNENPDPDTEEEIEAANTVVPFTRQIERA